MATRRPIRRLVRRLVRRLSPDAVAAFDHVPRRDLERARVVVVPFLTPGVAGMTVGRWILLRRGHEHDVALLAHELVHVRQWREAGAARFLACYLRDYGRARWAGLPHREAYRSIGAEREARETAGA